MDRKFHCHVPPITVLYFLQSLDYPWVIEICGHFECLKFFVYLLIAKTFSRLIPMISIEPSALRDNGVQIDI